MAEISVILNAYKRVHHLDEQIHSVINQTIKPKEIFIWNNSEKELPIDIKTYTIPITVFTSSRNLGVWARFFAAYNCNTEYIAMFDDDTIPGNRWFETCLKEMSVKEALYGANGIRFSNEGYISGSRRFGWYAGTTQLEEVDVIGHGWFFKRIWLKYFANDIPNTEEFKLMGEDIHLSYTLKKYGNIHSYVTIHDFTGDKNTFGSIKGWAYGTEGVALSLMPGAYDRFERAYNRYVRELGYVIVVNDK